jgi:hypothetical protein
LFAERGLLGHQCPMIRHQQPPLRALACS